MQELYNKNIPGIKGFLKQKPSNQIDLQKASREFLCPQLEQILDQIQELTGSWNPVEIYTASNYHQEKTKFLSDWQEKGSAVNPSFTYALAEQLKLTETQNKLKDLLSNTQKLRVEVDHKTAEENKKLHQFALDLTILKINDDLATCELVSGIKNKNDDQTKKAIEQKYGELEKEMGVKANLVFEKMKERANHKTTIKNEKTILSEKEKNWLNNTMFNASEIKAAFVWTLKKYKLLAKQKGELGFLVEVSDEATSIDVRDKNNSGQPIVFIPTDRTVNGRQLLSLIGHEIECHVRQSMNGAKLFRLGGGQLKIDDEAMYEGLAVQDDYRFEKDYFGETFFVPPPFYIQAIALAKKGLNFGQVFEVMLEKIRATTSESDFNQSSLLEQTWLTTYRIFRGSTDPENKSAYALTKDRGYLKGFLINQELSKLNEDEYIQLAITNDRDLKMLKIFALNNMEVPYPLLNAQQSYWEQVLKQRCEQANT
ncbi:MAG: flavohemoglobin expression-modulating QEGLA motif protein [Pseudomonadales bacterium]|jgi:hypothetical protein|nr:flavohemoglobin expression-modulating QEGLA motif protein [Pseudomonadales bacterium]